MVQYQKGNSLGPTRCLHLASSVHLLHLGHLHLLLYLEMLSRLSQKPNTARTSALQWQLPCSSSSLSKTRTLGPLSAARPLLRL